MDIIQHTKHHEKLHTSLDELIADFILNTKRHIDDTMLNEFVSWSYKQSINPEHSEDDCFV